MFLKNSIFFICFGSFNALILKIFFKIYIYIYYFDIFQHEKYYKKQSQPHSQINLKSKNTHGHVKLTVVYHMNAYASMAMSFVSAF